MAIEKIDKVATVAKFAQDKSARALKEGKQGHQQKSAQLEQLEQFRLEYEVKFGAAGGEGMAARQLQDYWLFMRKLNLAIEQQKLEVEAAGVGLGEVRDQWLADAQRTSALDHLVNIQRREQLLSRGRTEQKQSDEDTLSRRVPSKNREEYF
ncbi:MAG: flagellar FliJ protein [Alcanivorax sp.]|jgi:flagellar FliJ protein